VVLEGGGVQALNLEEFAVCNSLIHSCNVAVCARKIDYLFVGDRDSIAQTLLAVRCVQGLQAEEIGSVTVANVMMQAIGGVFTVSSCSMFEVSNVSIVDCGRFGIVNCASPVQLSSCSVSCTFPNLETRGHGARYSMVSLRGDSAYPIADIPISSLPVQSLARLSFQPDPLVKRQRMDVEISDLDLIKKMHAEGSLDPAPAITQVSPGLQESNTFSPDFQSFLAQEEFKKQKVGP